MQSGVDTDVPISQVLGGQAADMMVDHKAATLSVLVDNQLSTSENLSLDTGTAGMTPPSKDAESFTLERSVNATGPVVIGQLDNDSEHHGVLSDSPDVSSDTRAECTTVPTDNVRSLDSAYNLDDWSMAPPQLVATKPDRIESTPPSTGSNAPQSQQGPTSEHTSPNLPPDPKSVPETYQIGNSTNSQSLTHGNNCLACSHTVEVVIETQNESHKRLLRIVARRVGSCWTILARLLGVSEEDISCIKCHSFTPPERCSALLRKWSGQGPPSGHLWSTLEVALCHIGHCHLVSTISEQINSADPVSPQQDLSEELGIDLTDVKHSLLLTEVSVTMGSSWRLFCETQGLRLSSCEAISDTDVAFSVLIQWVNRERKPTFQSLMVALRESNLGYVSACLGHICHNT